jgi:predicted ATPase
MQQLKLASRALSTALPEKKLPNLIHRYEALISGGFIQTDASQLSCLERLQILLEDLHLYGGKLKTYEYERNSYRVKRQIAEKQLREELSKKQTYEGNSGGSGGWSLSQLFNTSSKEEQDIITKQTSNIELENRLLSLLGPAPSAPPAPKGVYLFGSVGSGKTMLADMLYDAAEESQVLPLQRRLHCNAALLELHSRMHDLEQKKISSSSGGVTDGGSDDFLAKNAKVARIAHRRLVRERMMTPLEEYSKGIAAANATIMLKAARDLLLGSPYTSYTTSTRTFTPAALLCFDEMQTTDPYNVAALKALTEAALQDGGTLVATSNRAPKELSPHGLHEAMFEHFVETLERGCDVVELSSPEDYRRTRIVLSTTNNTKGEESKKFYFWPLNASSAAQLESAWNSFKDKEINQPIEIPVMFGRTLKVTKRRGNTAAWFSFDDLCGKPLGPSDYIALASRFKNVFITDVPAMSMRVRDKARRFITLIDEVYNQRGRVVCTAAVELDELFTGKEVNEEPLVDLEGLQFEGAVEGAKLRRDLTQEGGVAPVTMTAKRIGALGGEEEKFAFARAVSRLCEMQSEMYNNV